MIYSICWGITSRNFNNSAVSKAKTACEVSGHRAGDHFVGVTKMVDLGSGSQRKIEDLMLTRYACYADFAPTIILKAKDFVAEITIFNARQHGMTTETTISQVYVTNN